MGSPKKTVRVLTEPVCIILEVRSIEVLHGNKIVGELNPEEVKRLRDEKFADFDIDTIEAVFSIIPDYDFVLDDTT